VIFEPKVAICLGSHLEEYVTRVIAAEAIHIRETELMLMKQAPE
jgi:hypothetical protein